eukprot:UN4919
MVLIPGHVWPPRGGVSCSAGIIPIWRMHRGILFRPGMQSSFGALFPQIPFGGFTNQFFFFFPFLLKPQTFWRTRRPFPHHQVGPPFGFHPGGRAPLCCGPLALFLSLPSFSAGDELVPRYPGLIPPRRSLGRG